MAAVRDGLAYAAPSDADDEVSIARAFGCTVRARGARRIGGRDWPVWEVTCSDNRQAIDLLDALASFDARTSSRVDALGRMLRAPDGSERGTAERIHAFVLASTVYHRDEDQVFQSSDLTLAIGEGNCVNSTRLFLALARVARLGGLAMPVVRGDGEIVHVAPQVLLAGKWQWAEVTVQGARIGESPYDVAARLGLIRDDLGSVPFRRR